jgi:hypothetical protein
MCVNLDKVLSRIGDKGWSIDLGKSRFLTKEIDFLGHRAGDIGVAPQSKDISALSQDKKPKKVKKMVSFIGLASYERKYIQDFTKYEKSLRDIIRNNDTKLYWIKEAEKSFYELKEEIKRINRLMRFDEIKETVI